MDIINSNLLNQLNSQLSEPIAEFPLDGKFHHFKNGKINANSSHVWATGVSWEFKGNTYQYVTAGDWRDGSKITVRSYETDKITKAERKHASDYIKNLEEETKRERDKSHADCKQKWETIFNDQLVESPTHPYLVFKKSNSNYRARVRNNSTLLIPIEHPDYGFTGVQQIFENPEKKGSYLKIFSKGLRIQGSFSRLTNFDISKTDTIYVCEGYATACSIYQAIKKPIVVCFFAANIIPTIASLKKINSNLKIIVAGDNDHQNKKNPGKHYASLASKQFSNVIYRLPSFVNGDGLTDFNDLHVCESLEKVSDQLLISVNDFVSIISLGHNSGSYYYVNTQTSEIFNLSANQHVQANLLAQATSKYWGQRFRFKTDRDGNPTSKPDWDYIAEQLFSEQREIGFFNNENVRGYGAWLDNDMVIFNSGKVLHVYNQDGTINSYPITDHNLNTKYIYEANKAIPFDHSNKLSEDELSDIIDCFSLASYKNANDHIYLLGFIALAQIPGILPWRSHNWLTGSRGSGKTTLLSWISQLCYNQGTIQDPTQAGLRQVIGYNSMPVFIDETEPNSPDARRRLDQIMDLIRQSSSPNSSRIIRGTVDGNAQSFLVSAIFMLSSIQVSIKNAADLSRFTVIEMCKNSRENFAKMRKIASKFEQYGPKLLSYILSQSHHILSNISLIHDFILDEYPNLDSRQADQISVLVAGYYALKHGGQIDELQFSLIMSMLNINESQYVQDNKETDEIKVIEYILSVRDRMSGLSIAAMLVNDEDHRNTLSQLGISLHEKQIAKYMDIFIASNSLELKKLLFDTEYQDYSKILKRSPDIIKQDATKRIFGRVTKGFIIRVKLDAEQEKQSQFEAPQYDDIPF